MNVGRKKKKKGELRKDVKMTEYSGLDFTLLDDLLISHALPTEEQQQHKKNYNDRLGGLEDENCKSIPSPDFSLQDIPSLDLYFSDYSLLDTSIPLIELSDSELSLGEKGDSSNGFASAELEKVQPDAPQTGSIRTGTQSFQSVNINAVLETNGISTYLPGLTSDLKCMKAKETSNKKTRRRRRKGQNGDEKKVKLYELGPLDDRNEERRRKDAIRAKGCRMKQKEMINHLKEMVCEEKRKVAEEKRKVADLQKRLEKLEAEKAQLRKLVLPKYGVGISTPELTPTSYNVALCSETVDISRQTASLEDWKSLDELFTLESNAAGVVSSLLA